MFLSGNVTVMVSDMDRAVRFYTEALAFKLATRYGNEWAQVEAAGLTIGLHPADKKAESSAGQGGLSIGLQVDRLGPAMETLKSRGVQFQPQVVEDKGIKLAFFSDPDGNPLYLCQVTRM